jgi:hypothetical protein
MTLEEALLRADLSIANGGAASGGAASGGAASGGAASGGAASGGAASGGAHSEPSAEGGAGGANADCPELNEGPPLHGPGVRMGVLCCYDSVLFCG